MVSSLDQLRFCHCIMQVLVFMQHPAYKVCMSVGVPVINMNSYEHLHSVRDIFCSLSCLCVWYYPTNMAESAHIDIISNNQITFPIPSTG